MQDSRVELGMTILDNAVWHLQFIKIRNRANEQAIEILDSLRAELEKENNKIWTL
jgi:hypothetical protein